MRQDLAIVNAGMDIEQFREKFPLGSKNQVIAVDGSARYVGLALVRSCRSIPERERSRPSPPAICACRPPMMRLQLIPYV